MRTTWSSYPEICWWRLGLYPTGLFLLEQISGIWSFLVEQSVCRRLLMQFQIAVWVSYQTDFVSVMTMLCSLLKMGSILRDYFYGYETISEPSLVPRPPSEKSRKGLATRMAMRCPRGLYTRANQIAEIINVTFNRGCANSSVYGDHHGVQLTRLSKFPEAE